MKKKKESKSQKQKDRLHTTQAIIRYSARKNGKVISKTSNYKPKWLVPFDEKGNQLHYPTPKYTFDKWYRMKLDMKSIVWKEPYTFEDTIELLELKRGRSAAYFICKGLKTDVQYVIFLVDLLKILKNSVISYGTLPGTWTFAKRGQYFGIQLLQGSAFDDSAKVGEESRENRENISSENISGSGVQESIDSDISEFD